MGISALHFLHLFIITAPHCKQCLPFGVNSPHFGHLTISFSATCFSPQLRQNLELAGKSALHFLHFVKCVDVLKFCTMSPIAPPIAPPIGTPIPRPIPVSYTHLRAHET